jgi:glucose/arabinose dehydrogenase
MLAINRNTEAAQELTRALSACSSFTATESKQLPITKEETQTPAPKQEQAQPEPPKQVPAEVPPSTVKALTIEDLRKRIDIMLGRDSTCLPQIIGEIRRISGGKKKLTELTPEDYPVFMEALDAIDPALAQ